MAEGLLIQITKNFFLNSGDNSVDNMSPHFLFVQTVDKCVDNSMIF